MDLIKTILVVVQFSVRPFQHCSEGRLSLVEKFISDRCTGNCCSGIVQESLSGN
jgi:hypothetical protein